MESETMDEEYHATLNRLRRHLSGPYKYLIWGAAIVAVLALLSFGWVLARTARHPLVPTTVSQKLSWPVYVPKKLPGTYKLDPTSFTLVENGSVLLFQAKDGVNSDLVFSEQKRPKSFNYDQLYKTEFESAKTLNNVPYSSVWSKISAGRVMLSVVTDDTWIVLTTTAPLGNNEMLRIAQSIAKS